MWKQHATNRKRFPSKRVAKDTFRPGRHRPCRVTAFRWYPRWRLWIRQTLWLATGARGWRTTRRTTGCAVRTTTSARPTATDCRRWWSAGIAPCGWMTGTSVTVERDDATADLGGTRTRPPGWTRCLARTVRASRTATGLQVSEAVNTQFWTLNKNIEGLLMWSPGRYILFVL